MTDHTPIPTTDAFLQNQARVETKQPNQNDLNLVLSHYGDAETGMDAQIHLDIIVQCPHCRARHRKGVKYYVAGQDVALTCETCGRGASIRIY